MSDHDFAVQVRITRTEDGWHQTVVDTPTFYLLSNAQFGTIHTADTVEKTAANMFAGLMREGDEIFVTASPYTP